MQELWEQVEEWSLIYWSYRSWRARITRENRCYCPGCRYSRSRKMHEESS